MIYDLEKHKYVEVMPTGFMGQISFERLAELFKTSGETHENEIITHMKISDNGMIIFRVEQK